MLTPDQEDSNEGQIHHRRFKCRPFIRPFLESLKAQPRALQRIKALGAIPGEKPFDLLVYAPDTYIGSGESRLWYWRNLELEALENTIVFFDPDNGYEIESRRGDKWIEHAELKGVLTRLPRSSAVVVYQHRPRRKWDDVFSDLTRKTFYVNTAAAVYESDLAFVGMAENALVGSALTNAMSAYSDGHDDVKFLLLQQREESK